MRERLVYGIVIVLAVALSAETGYLAASLQRGPVAAGGQPTGSGSPFLVSSGEAGETQWWIYSWLSGSPALKGIVVPGVGRAGGKPNLAVLRLGAATQAPNATAAVAQNAEIMNRVIDALKAHIPEEDIETASFNLYPKQSTYSGNIVGFEAVHMLKVTSTDLEGVGRLIDMAIVAGANRVEGVYFTLTEESLEEMNALARRRAVENSRVRAERIAESLGVKIVGVGGAVEETYQYPYSGGWYAAYPMSELAATPITPPTEVEVTVIITATYMIE